MARYKIITKKDCFFCNLLIKWLADKQIDWIEIDYLDPKNNDDPLMKNQTFYAIYCDMSACVESLPIVVKDDKEFYYGELWDLKNNTLVEERAREVFGL